VEFVAVRRGATVTVEATGAVPAAWSVAAALGTPLAAQGPRAELTLPA
jgi:precorrin-3B methylase